MTGEVHAVIKRFCGPVQLAAIFALLTTAADAHLNIFLDQQEVRRLMGLNAEIFYVREGVINEYALNFVVPVQAHMRDLYFTWQSVGERSLPYSAAIEVMGGDKEAMDLPSLNISYKGNVPNKLQVFQLRFPCTGKVSSEVDVVFHLNVTLPENRKYHNVTQLKFKRKKICLKTDSHPVKNETSVLEPESLLVSSSGTVYIATGAACALVVILLAITSVLYLQRKKALVQEAAYDVPYCASTNVFLAANNGRRNGSIGSASYATIASFQKVPLTPASTVFTSRRSIVATPGFHSNQSSVKSNFEKTSSAANNKTTQNQVSAYQVSGLDFIHNSSVPKDLPVKNSPRYTPEFSSRPQVRSTAASSVVSVASSYDPKLLDPAERLQRLAVPHFRITLRNLINEGTFGRIYSGLYLHPDTSREGQVLVKTVSEHASAAQKTVFLAEGTLLAGLQHRHILSVLGCCIDKNNSPMIVYPWVSKGNLKRFLISCRSGTEVKTGLGNEVRTTLMTQDVVDMAIQVVLGLLYLHRHHLIHKDVSARNCVIDDRLRVKVTDPALSRDLFPNDYHCLGDNENRPIKWMSLESLTRHEFTTASDVWSLGVFLWELTTLAQQPYIEVDPFEMESYLKDDYRLAQPHNCPDELFAMMACCWIADPKARPTLLQLLACLQDFQTALGRFI